VNPETVVARLRPHVRALFWPTVLLIAVAAVVGFFWGAFTVDWQNALLLGGAGAVLLVGWLAPLLRWLARRYTITTRRTIVSGGILRRTRQELLHARVHDITVSRTLLQSVFRSGDVILETGGEHPVVLVDVPSADLVQAALHDLHDGTDETYGSDRVHP
jgi:uncharacterized membrane protein YdbT with pleckstrin-like domain